MGDFLSERSRYFPETRGKTQSTPRAEDYAILSEPRLRHTAASPGLLQNSRTERRLMTVNGNIYRPVALIGHPHALHRATQMRPSLLGYYGLMKVVVNSDARSLNKLTV